MVFSFVWAVIVLAIFSYTIGIVVAKMKKKDVFINQMKTVEDIGERIEALINKHRDLKNNNLGVMFRTVIDPNSSTAYEEGFHGKGGISSGVRECDYKFSASDPLWIEASDEHGLSFSSTVKHAIDTMHFLGGFQKRGTKVQCAHWILENSESIPEHMAFVQDPDKPEHYLLAVTKRMKLTDLVF